MPQPVGGLEDQARQQDEQDELRATSTAGSRRVATMPTSETGEDEGDRVGQPERRATIATNTARASRPTSSSRTCGIAASSDAGRSPGVGAVLTRRPWSAGC